MKLYVSDMHIGSGNQKDDFVYDAKFIELLDKYEDQITEFFIVGDFLELMHVKDKKILCETVQECMDLFDLEILNKIYNAHTALFERLKKFSSKVRIRYIAGNHDYHVLFSEKIREKVFSMTGCEEVLPFYYDEDWEIFVIHGNQFDAVNRLSYDGKNNIIPTFGEYMAKFMSSNFDIKMSKILPDELISDYDNIRPLLDVFVWLDYINERYCLNYNLKEEWISEFINLINAKQTRNWLKINFPKYYRFTDFFVNKFGGMKLGESLVRTVMYFREFKKSDMYLKAAKRLLENNFLIPRKNLVGYSDEDISLSNDKVKGLIMGHCHRPSYNQVNCGKIKKFYANTGAWKHVVMRNKGVNDNEFIKRSTVSYLVIDEYNKNLHAKLSVEEFY